MAKDYAKFVPPKPRAAKRNLLRASLILPAFFVVVCGLLGGYYFYQKKMGGIGAGSNRVAVAISTYFSHHKKDSLNLAKKISAEQSPSVHFDFYSQLPNMQVALPEEGAGASVVLPTAKSFSQPVLANIENPQHAVPTEKTAKVNPDEVTTLLEAEAPKPTPAMITVVQQYIIELGVFDTIQAAGLLADALSGVGFHAEVVKLNHNGHKVYSVQQGPFKNLEIAKLTQQRLQKRGIVGEIHKTV